jgi:hypothetical protein
MCMGHGMPPRPCIPDAFPMVFLSATGCVYKSSTWRFKWERNRTAMESRRRRRLKLHASGHAVRADVLRSLSRPWQCPDHIIHPAVGGSDIVDVNNANIRVYTRFPGMYPTIARKIVKGIPYASIDEMLQKQAFTTEELQILDKYLKNLAALEPAPEVRHQLVFVSTVMKCEQRAFPGQEELTVCVFAPFCSTSSTPSTTACTGKL